MAGNTELPRLAAPLLLAAAIVVSFGAMPKSPPVELEPGQPPAPSAADLRDALARALGPGSPAIAVGSARARVTVLEFADFGCAYCARFALNAYPGLAAEFVASGKVRWEFVPFVLGMFPNGEGAARAGQCAAEQGVAAFGRMHDRLFAQQAAWQGVSDPADTFASLAAGAGLNRSRFAVCYGAEAPLRRTRAAGELADRLGVGATPTFFVNGRRIEGALPADEFRAVLRQALEETR